MRVYQCLLYVLTALLVGCTPHTDPLADWQSLGELKDPSVPEAIKQDAHAYFQSLPQVERTASEWIYVGYLTDGHGQHAVDLEVPNNGEHWHYSLIYDQNNRRIKVLKYSTGSYMS